MENHARPVIGIVSSERVDYVPMFGGMLMPRAAQNLSYLQAVEKNGGTALLLTWQTPLSFHAQLSMCDGILLPGGPDVAPFWYHEEPEKGLGEIHPNLDDAEFRALAHAEQRQLPVLGICRGAQVINVFYDGTLHQDLTALPETLKHQQTYDRSMPTHTVSIRPGTA